MRLLIATLLIGFAASAATAQDWGNIATISSTMGISASRICIGEGLRGDIGCPAYAPSITTAGDVSITGNVSANKFLGDGSGLTGISTQGDRIVSGSLTMLAISNTGYVSLTTGAVNWGYLGDTTSFLPKLGANNISSTNISSTLHHYTPRPVTAFAGAGGSYIVSGTSSVSATNVGSGAIRFATSGGGNVMNISGSYVGIGTAAPSELLNLSGGSIRLDAPLASSHKIIFADATNGQDMWLYRPASSRDLRIASGAGTDFMTILQSNGNVGIGTAGPGSKLHIYETNNSTVLGNKERVLLENDSTTGLAGGEIVFGTGDVNVKRYVAFGSAIVGNDGATGARGRAYIATKTNSADTTMTERLVVLNDGNVGIGTTSPGEKLEVNGNVKMGYVQRTNTCAGPGAGGLATCAVSCSGNEYVIGGGCGGTGGSGNLQNSYPSSNTQWTCTMNGLGGSGFTNIIAYAVCANMR